LIFIHAFAGAGRSRVRDAWDGADEDDVLLLDNEFVAAEAQFIEGSPRRALSLERPFDKHYFFDADAGRAQLLSDLKNEFPARQINVQVGDANQLIQQLVPSLSRRMTRGVAFLDPYGPHLEWQTIEALGQTGKFEVIINFPLGMAINRLITRNGDIPERWRQGLNACFGNTEWERLVYREQSDLFGGTIKEKVDDAAKRLLDHYVARLQTVFGHVATPSAVRNTRGVSIYFMLWAGPHKLGHKIADYILSKGEK
jgi:three-Cys-motif partner protein